MWEEFMELIEDFGAQSNIYSKKKIGARTFFCKRDQDHP